jgi:glutamyl-tRNA reductase
MNAALPMSLFAFGLNHESAPLDVRERVAFPAERVSDALRNLVERRPVSEAAILSTCNRTEVYCHTHEPDAAIDWLADFHRLPTGTVADHLYQLPGEAAVRHAFRVAAGLDSMVLGETQILGQMKQAAKSAESAGTLGWMLRWPRTFARRPRSVPAPSPWPQPRYGWQSASSPTCHESGFCSSALAR